MSFDPKLIEAKLTLERIPSNEIPSIRGQAFYFVIVEGIIAKRRLITLDSLDLNQY